MEISRLKHILEQHRLWIQSNFVQGKCANLAGADLEGADLEGADLYYANLLDANLRDANLYRANLRDANLYRANLRGADLTRAKLWSASLYGANLTGADMEDANLWGANLTGANLTNANLTHANLTNANLQNTILNCSIGLPDVSWIIPGCLVQLNHIKYDFYLEKEEKYENFIQESLGFFIQNNVAEETFDMLAGDRIIRNIPHWVKLSGMKQVL